MRQWIVIVSILLFPVFAQAAEPALPNVVVRGLYGPYLPGGDLNRSVTDNRTVQDAVLSKSLRAAVRTAAERDKNDSIGGILGFDPIINGQDYDIKKLVVRVEKMDRNKTAVVIVTFRNLGTAAKLRYSMVLETSAWRVDNIESLYDPLWNLRSLLSGG